MCAAGLWWCSLAPRSCVSRPPRVSIVVCCVGDAWWRLTDFARVRVLVELTQFFEIATQWVHARFKDDKASLEMLHKLEMELMILGFLSFTLVMSNEYNLPWIPNESWFHAFEFAHILLFYAACFLMTRAVIMRGALTELVKNMDRLEREDIQVTLDKFIESTQQPESWPAKIRRKLLGDVATPRWDLAWQIMRKVVPRKPDFRDHHRTRDVDDDFDFARYCELILQRDIVHSVHISGPIWFVIGMIGFIVMVASLDFNDLDSFANAEGMMAAPAPAVVVPVRPDSCNRAMRVSNVAPAASESAAAFFGGPDYDGPVLGVVTFTPEPAGVVMAIDLRWDDAEATVSPELAWHIHENAADPTSADCSETGGHYIPECIGPEDTCPEGGTMECPSTALADRAGELSERVGGLCDGTSTCLRAGDAQAFSVEPLCGAGGQDCLGSSGGLTLTATTRRQILRLPADPIIELTGPDRIVGRSIVIHGEGGARIACATITPAEITPCEPPAPTSQNAEIGMAAFALFQHPLGCIPADCEVFFSLTFTDIANIGTAGGTHTRVGLSVPGGVFPDDAGGWHVHVDPINVDGADVDAVCGAAATGGHYDPDCFGSASHAAIGELTHRHGPLPQTQTGDTKIWIDSHLPLRGSKSIVGRSIVVHSTADGSPRIACATIEVTGAGRRRQLAHNLTSAVLQRATSTKPMPVNASRRSTHAAANEALSESTVHSSTSIIDGSHLQPRRQLEDAGAAEMMMPTDEARQIVLTIIIFGWVTTILLHVLLGVQHIDMAKLLKARGWHSDDAEVLRKCVDDLVSAKQLDDTIVEVEHGETHGPGAATGGGGHGGGVCTFSGYNKREKVINLITDALICLNCFYSSFCVLYGLYATGWTGFGIVVAILLDIFLFVPAIYQFFTVGPAIARDRAILAAYIHFDEGLLREVEVYTARTLEIKAALCEAVLRKLEHDSTRLTDVERANKAAEFFFGYHAHVEKSADDGLTPAELEEAIVALRLRVTHSEIRQLVRDLDKDQSGVIGRDELGDFLTVNLTQRGIASNKAAAKTNLGFGPSAGSSASEVVEEQQLLQLGGSGEAQRSQQLEAELQQLREENTRLQKQQRRSSAAATGSQPSAAAGGSVDADVLAEMQALATQVEHLQEDKARLTKRMKAMSMEGAAAPGPAATGGGRKRTAPALGTLPTPRTATTPVRASRRAPPPLPAKSVVFDQYDKDSSGSLDLAEVRTLLRARGIAPAAVEQYLAKHDADGDGSISQAEFDGLYAQLATQAGQGRSAPRAVRAGSRRQVARGASSRI